jgi:ribonuclease-3
MQNKNICVPLHIYEFEKIMKYKFKDTSLLIAALSHGSLRSNMKAFKHKKDSFERLEFLGDRVLGLVIAQWLYQKFPKDNEGTLAKKLAKLVCKDCCLKIAKDLNLACYIHGLSQDMMGRSSVLADCVEALIAAVYIDGGLEESQKFILRLWSGSLDTISFDKDAKTQLQELLQKNQQPLPVYKIMSVEGPDHCPEFIVELRVGHLGAIQSRGPSKKDAEQKAAFEFLQTYNQPDLLFNSTRTP